MWGARVCGTTARASVEPTVPVYVRVQVPYRMEVANAARPLALLMPGAHEAAGVLESAGLASLLVTTPEEALAASQREDAVLLAIGSPEGAALVRSVRSDARGVSVPVLALGETTDTAWTAEALEAGADGVLSLPAEPHEVAVRVWTVLAQAGRRAAAAEPVERCAAEILSALPSWLLVLDGNGDVRFANSGLLACLGHPLADFTGRSFAQVVGSRLVDADAVLGLWREAVELRREMRVTSLRFRSDGGDEFVVDLRMQPFGLLGKPHFLVAMHEVAAGWWTRDSALVQDLKLEDIVNGMGASLAILGSDLRVLWANSTFTAWFARRAGERFDEVLEGLDRDARRAPDVVFTGREHVSAEWAHVRDSGDRRYYRNLVFPVRDGQGALRELVVVTQDVTGITLQKEQHVLLQELATLLQSTLDIDRLLHIILTCVTAGHALGFNRAFIFMVDEDGRLLRGELGVGPSSQEEAFRIWAELARSPKSLAELAAGYEEPDVVEDRPLAAKVRRLSYPLEGPGAAAEILVRTVVENRIQLVRNAWVDARVTPAFREEFGSREFVTVPLQAKGRRIGVLLADNLFSGRPISQASLDILELFAAAAGLAVDNARTYAQLKQSLENLTEAQEALIHSERLATVGRMAAHVAHEIRNPLVTIGGFARSILRRSHDAAGVQRSAEIVCQEVRRLEDLLTGVMDFARPSEHAPSLRSLNAVLRRAVGTIEHEVRENGVELHLDLAPDLPPGFIDDRRLRQVVLNLVRNAVESMTDPDRAERPRRLTIRSRLDEEMLTVDVEDTGPGIPADLMPRLFEPFMSRKVGGTGLGLAVVRKILLDHGGDIMADSVPGRGAVFTLRLPCSGGSAVDEAVLEQGGTGV